MENIIQAVTAAAKPRPCANFARRYPEEYVALQPWPSPCHGYEASDAFGLARWFGFPCSIRP